MTTVSTPSFRGQNLKEHSACLLVVDDDPLNLDMLSRRLERTGFSVKVASCGRDALRMIHEQSFDLILLDQMMPEMSGSEVLRTLRADALTKTLPVIMVTAVASSDSISEALDNGANDYITKPVDYKVALARIRAQLARRTAEAALRQSEERYALVAKASREGLWDWNLATGFMYFSPRWREMLGLDAPIENTAEAWFSRIVKSDRDAIARQIEEYLRGTQDVLLCAYRMRHADGSPRWMSCHAITTRDANGIPIRMAGAQSDITEEKTRDPLTGLPNRLPVISQLEWVLENAPAGNGGGTLAPAANYAVLFLDLNEFKAVNDSLGHVAGDQLLVAIASRLKLARPASAIEHSLLRTPLIARMGGDEFAILLEGEFSLPEVVLYARDLQSIMDDPFRVDGVSVRCIFSIGISFASETHQRPEDILREADIAMYTTKVENRGRIVSFDSSMRSIATQQFDLENDIRFAIVRNELKVVYQPKVDLNTGLTYGFEALVRWQHRTRGLLQPSVFIPIAEKTGIIIELGQWILREACLQVRAWNREFPKGMPLELSVNLSPREFKQDRLAERVTQTLVDVDFPPALLHLELTEGALFEDIAAARETLHSLKKIGVGLDLDDFGSGYSSLKYLRELPFDSLKIDRYFVAALDSGQTSSADLIGAILNMANVLGLEVVAEGIETAAHSATLCVLGCRFGQGYHFGKPLDSEAIGVLLRRERGPDHPPPPVFALAEPLQGYC